MRLLLRSTTVTLAAVAFALLPALPVAAATSVLTRSYDNARTGANITETQLTPALVATKGLKLQKSLPIDDDPRIEAQPLYVPGLKMKDGKLHDVIFVASMGNHVFAYDAEAPAGHDLLWKTKVGVPYTPPEKPNPDHRSTTIDDWGINIKWGILSTPVIDRDANSLYIVNWVYQKKENGPALFLHRVRLSDGKETSTPAGGLRLAAKLTDDHGQVRDDAHGEPVTLRRDQKQRAALLLVPLTGAHKTLFVATTGGENPGSPHGWVLAFDIDSFTQTAAWVSTPNGFGGGMWQASQGLAADEAGAVYAMTGNGGYIVDNGGHTIDFNGDTDFAEAFVKLAYAKNAGGKHQLELVDWFIPFRDVQRNTQPNYNYRDQDLGSGAPVVLPGTNLLIGAGKDGLLYVLDRAHLGKKVGDLSVLKVPPLYLTYNGVGLPIQGHEIDFPLGNPAHNPNKTHHLHGSPVYWDGDAGSMIFNWGENESLRAWTIDRATGKVNFVAKGAEVASAKLAADPNSIGGMPGGMISVSSNGKTPHTGIVWTLAPIDGDANHFVVDGIARAYDATQLDPTPIDPATPRLKLLWDSAHDGVAFKYDKFCPPVVADGRLLVPTYSGRVDVYTLNP